jgi:hypothetical protein
MLQLLNAAVATARLRPAKDVLARFLANAFPLLYPVLNKVFKGKDQTDSAGFLKQVLDEVEDRLGGHLN